MKVYQKSGHKACRAYPIGPKIGQCIISWGFCSMPYTQELDSRNNVLAVAMICPRIRNRTLSRSSNNYTMEKHKQIDNNTALLYRNGNQRAVVRFLIMCIKEFCCKSNFCNPYIYDFYEAFWVPSFETVQLAKNPSIFVLKVQSFILLHCLCYV